MPKGRMGEKVYHMFHEAGLCQENLLDESRKLIFTDEENGLRFFLVKPSDVASYVEHGAADIGIVGRDILLETEADVLDVLRFAIGQCDIAITGAKNFQKDASRPLKVATKYPTIARKYFSSRSQPVELIYLNGSIELAPLVGLADVIVDIVETGTTLKENGLEVFEKITDSSAHLVVNRTSWRFKQSEIYEIIQKVGAKND
ncbi:ATP phosphoribosyltransferase [Enterococcus dispar]|uniref:ATP phosphoribosyltransferase n=1 Tax=Enterococcus dispar TaxID=44009 RepID=UPI00249214D9|nr:ATP phosphoribosyltransferase [Enterococcus dispar]